MSRDDGGDRLISPAFEGVVDQEPGRRKTDHYTECPKNFSPYGLSLANVDKSMQIRGLQELPNGVHDGDLNED